jgi:hypothetical protein
MVGIQLQPNTRAVVTGLLARRQPTLLPILELPAPTRDDASSLLAVIGDELSTFGFDQRSEPTAYGLLLETIIDEINKIGFK